jgi:hypothetical protein
VKCKVVCVTELSVLKPGILLLRKDPWYPLDRRLGGPQNCLAALEMKDLPLPKIKAQLSHLWQVNLVMELSQLINLDQIIGTLN